MWWEHFVVAEGQGLQGRRIWDLSLGVKRGKSVDEITSVVMISMLLESGTAKCSPVSGGASSMERRRQTTRRLPLKFLEGVKRRVEQNLQNETKALHETSLDLLSVQRAFIHSKIWKSKKKNSINPPLINNLLPGTTTTTSFNNIRLQKTYKLTSFKLK